MLIRFALLACVGLLAACGANGPGNSGPASLSAEQGTIIHNASGFQFPNSAGGFQRMSASNPARTDIGVGYVLVLPAGGIVGIVHIDRAPALLATGQARRDIGDFTFDTLRSNIVLQHKDARYVGIRPVSIVQQGRIRSGQEAIYEYTDTLGGKLQPVRTELYVFAPATPGFDMDYRFTYPAGMDVGQSIRNFMAVLPWTFRGLP